MPGIICEVDTDAKTVGVQTFGPHGGEYLTLEQSPGLKADSGWDFTLPS